MFYCIFFLEIDYFREINLREIKVTCWEKKNNSMENLYLANPPRILGYLLSWWFNSWYLPLTMDFLGDFRGQERREDVNIWVKRQKNAMTYRSPDSLRWWRFYKPSLVVHLTVHCPALSTCNHHSLFTTFTVGKSAENHGKPNTSRSTNKSTLQNWQFVFQAPAAHGALIGIDEISYSAISFDENLPPNHCWKSSKENKTNLFKWSHLEHLMH